VCVLRQKLSQALARDPSHAEVLITCRCTRVDIDEGPCTCLPAQVVMIIDLIRDHKKHA
jgi:hypothetical protein